MYSLKTCYSNRLQAMRSAKFWVILTCGLPGPAVEDISAVYPILKSVLYIWGMLMVTVVGAVGLVTPSQRSRDGSESLDKWIIHTTAMITVTME
jgi:hypothetical protein